MKGRSSVNILLTFISLTLILTNCDRGKKQDQQKISRNTISWSPTTDSLLHDTTKVNQVVDSLKKEVLKADKDTTSIIYLNELAQEWKNLPNLILANEALEKSRKLHYKYGEIDALVRLGYYYYWIDDYAKADSFLTLAFNQSVKHNFKKIQVQALSALGKVVRIQGNYAGSITYFRQALNIASKMGDKNQSAFSLNCIGEAYRLEGDNPEALYYFEQALAISKQTGDKNRIASSLSSIGDVSRIQDDYSKALDYFQQALTLSKETGDKNMAAFCYNNIGEVYRMQGDITKGLGYFQRALVLAKEIGDKTRISSCLSSIGDCYRGKGELVKALDYFQQTLKIAEELGDKTKLAYCYNGMGQIYIVKKETDKAFDYFMRAKILSEEIQDKSILADCLSSLGNLYLEKKDMVNARKYAEQCMVIAKENNTPSTIQTAAELMYRVQEKTGNFQEAYKAHVMYIRMRDSVVNRESMKKFASQEYKAKEAEMQTAQLKKDIVYKAEQIKKESEIKQQKVVRNGFIIGAILLCGLVFFIYRNLKQSRKAHHIISEQKKQVEVQKSHTEQQKKLVEEKQKEIVDSINYAKRIQQALFAHDEILKQNLKEYFVLFKPKDIISGDFYWATEKVGIPIAIGRQSAAGKEKTTERFYLAACDSTGHGVPGAFMSLLNISFLNEAVIEKNISAPNEVFDHVRKRLITTISQDGKQDGMDGILICFDGETISYAAAYNSPLLIHNNIPVEFPTDKMPVGKGEKEAPFALHTINTVKGDTIYLYTDGYADQFGGRDGKKFMQKQLKEFLLEVHHLPMEKQKELLDKKFEEWRGQLDQVDDVTIIGVRV